MCDSPNKLRGGELKCQEGFELYREKSMGDLPIVRFEEKIVETVEQNPIVVVIGETGSGKSTQLPQILYRRGYANSGIIAVTQPRRVAAVSVSR